MIINWQYFKDPNEVNDAILHGDPNWRELTSAEQIISISWDNNQGCYVVFWREPLDQTLDY